jgi:hypothetical protein
MLGDAFATIQIGRGLVCVMNGNDPLELSGEGTL